MMYSIVVFGKDGIQSDEFPIPNVESITEAVLAVMNHWDFYFHRPLEPGDEFRIEETNESYTYEDRSQWVLTHENQLEHISIKRIRSLDEKCVRCGSSFVKVAWSPKHVRCNGCGSLTAIV